MEPDGRQHARAIAKVSNGLPRALNQDLSRITRKGLKQLARAANVAAERFQVIQDCACCSPRDLEFLRQEYARRAAIKLVAAEMVHDQWPSLTSKKFAKRINKAYHRFAVVLGHDGDVNGLVMDLYNDAKALIKAV